MRDWMGEEIPFLAGQRPSERAGFIACGTPQMPLCRFSAPYRRTTMTTTAPRITPTGLYPVDC